MVQPDDCDGKRRGQKGRSLTGYVGLSGRNCIKTHERASSRLFPGFSHRSRRYGLDFEIGIAPQRTIERVYFEACKLSLNLQHQGQVASHLSE
jgi:hypothetical protein